MIFGRRKLQSHLEQLRWHTSKIGELELMRDDYEAHGLDVMVLAVNWEIVSHASRALGELRKAEELSAAAMNGGEMRDFLKPKLDLPALPRNQVDTTDPAQVVRLYSEFRRSNKGKGAAQREYEERQRGR